MKTGKTTKRALVSSALAIVLCLAMLIGTTFAWFTDTASTSVNKIQAGNLKISLVNGDGEDLTNSKIQWTAKGADGKQHPVENVLWEPGCTYKTEQFYLRNDGNLAVKYKLNLSFTGDTKLLEVLEFSALVSGDNVPGGMISLNSLDALNGYEGHLLPASESVGGTTPENVAFKITAKMKKEAGNEYQGLSLGDINITVLATQYTYENDSFGKTYDENAQYPVSSSEELAEKLGTLSAGQSLPIAPGVYALPTAAPAAGVTLTGAGKGKTVLKPETKSYKVKDATYKNMTINGTGTSSFDNNGVIWLDGSNSVLDDVEVVGGGMNTYGYSVRAGANTTVKNSYIHGAFRAIMAYDVQGTLLVENSVLAPQCYTINIDGGTGKLVINDSTLKGWTSYTSTIESATFTGCIFEKNTESGSYGYNYLRPQTNTTLKDCAFGAGFQLGAGKSGFTITFENCTFNGVPVTADNVRLLTDSDADEQSNLSGCTIIVNGVTVTW